MQEMTLNEVVEAVKGEVISSSDCKRISGITTDSRKAAEGVLFIPLEGDKFDGHEFIRAAFDMGASAALTHKEVEPLCGETIIKVNDTMQALADLASYYKAKCNIPSVAVTGSVGKTTTKDMIAGVLSVKYKTLKTPGNFNNQIGLPLTIFKLEKDDEAAVLEMGMNHAGEIKHLVGIAKPDIAVITNIGMSHIENLGSREGIFKAKMEVASLFTDKNVLVVNGDDDFLAGVKGSVNYKVVNYGLNETNDVYAENIRDNGVGGVTFDVVAENTKTEINIPVAGRYNVYNALAAISVGMLYGISPAAAAEGIKKTDFTEMRMSISEVKGMTLINDCYNASPASISAALEVLASVRCERRIAVLGDVMEIGDFAKDALYSIGSDVVKNKIDLLVTAGDNSAYIASGAKDFGLDNIKSFAKTLEAAEYVKNIVKSGDAVLIKASRGMHFEDIYKAIIA